MLNAAHFSRSFRAAYGVPPVEYRGMAGPAVMAPQIGGSMVPCPLTSDDDRTADRL